jgi:8-oxo-dGTP diphosphatase
MEQNFNGRTQPEKADNSSLQDFKVGVDNVIFSVDTAQNRLLVLLVMGQEEPA